MISTNTLVLLIIAFVHFILEVQTLNKEFKCIEWSIWLVNFYNYTVPEYTMRTKKVVDLNEVRTGFYTISSIMMLQMNWIYIYPVYLY